MVTDACSTWKQTRSTDASSSSGRFKTKRLVIVSGEYVSGLHGRHTLRGPQVPRLD